MKTIIKKFGLPCLIAIHLSACQPNTEQLADQPQVITLTKQDVAAIKIDRYQPSFGISGIINHGKADSTSQLSTKQDPKQDQNFEFIGLAPRAISPFLHIGDAVNVTVNNQILSGQIRKITPDGDKFIRLKVQLDLDNNEQHTALKIGQAVDGRIEYGQMAVGALIPKRAVIDEHFSEKTIRELGQPPHKPSNPLTAQVWLVKQDQSVTLADIEIIEYQPDTEQYLVSGISDDRVVVITPLPKTAQGKQIKLD